jgi:hypothetical protein
MLRIDVHPEAYEELEQTRSYWKKRKFVTIQGALMKAKKPRQNHLGQNNLSKSFNSFAPNGFAF